MFYVLTDVQMQAINDDLAAISEPNLPYTVSSGMFYKVHYLDFIHGAIMKYVPHTQISIPPSTSAVFSDVLGAPVVTSDSFDQLVSQTPQAHDHDIIYSPLSHDHDPAYSPVIHTHDPDYSPITHNHDISYSPVGHTHPPGPHDHDTLYAPISHVDETVIHADTILAPYTFTMEGNGASGVWLTASTRSGIPSDLAPAISPADCILQAITYSNEADNSLFSLDFYIDGAAVPSYTWDIQNARYGYKIIDETLMPPEFFLPQGSRLSLRIGALTSAPKDAFVILYFALIGDVSPVEFFGATI